MAKQVRSARGELVDFDLLVIKQQLATAPAPVSVSNRRKYIDEKDGFKTRTVITPQLPSALSMGLEAAEISASVTDSEKEE